MLPFGGKGPRTQCVIYGEEAGLADEDNEACPPGPAGRSPSDSCPLFTMDDPGTFTLYPTVIPVTWWLCLQRIATTKTTVMGGVDRAVIMLDKYLGCVCVYTHEYTCVYVGGV